MESSRLGGGFTTSSSAETTGVGGMGGGICVGCGNPAKKECLHFRCRTCCKSGGFECPTHVKSTYVSQREREERRERREQRLQQARGEAAKRQREEEDPKRPNTSGSGSGGSVFSGDFPAEVNCRALLRRVTVTNLGNPRAQFAYQTAVNIGGDVFRGILHNDAANPNWSVGDSFSSAAPAATVAASRNANADMPSSAASSDDSI